MPSAISALSGVQWTDLNGINLPADQAVSLKNDLGALTTAINLFEEKLNRFISDPTYRGVTPQIESINLVIPLYSPILDIQLQWINSALGTSYSRYGITTIDGLRQFVVDARTYLFMQSSKLPVADGGGMKTYNGKWYVNGQQVNYLDITFAVRVNQLFVINNTVTAQLKQVQANNIRIKVANAMSAVISSVSPTTGTVAVKTFILKFIQALTANGIDIPIRSTGNTPNTVQQASLECGAMGPNSFSLAQGVNGVMMCVYRGANGSYQTIDWKGAPTLDFLVANGITMTNAFWDISKIQAMMPSSLNKLFDTNTASYTHGRFLQDANLSQQDCTAITTELKSFTSSIDSENQVAQTQLDQYNNKRSEVLDNISNIVKSNNNMLSGIARRLG